MGPSVKRAAVLTGVVASVLLVASVALVWSSDPSALSEPAAAQAADDQSSVVEQIARVEPEPAPQQTDVTPPAVNPVALTDGLSTQEAQWMLDAARWCPPIDTLSSDMEALRCWLTVSAGRIEPDLKINFGDLPAWGEIDVAALAEQLAAYEAEAAEQARVAAGPSKQTSEPPTPQPRPGVQLATTYDGLHHQCHTQRVAAACNALFDLAAGGGTYAPGTNPPAPQPEAPPQEPAVPVELDFEASERLHKESLAELARLISENCANGGSGRYFATSGRPVEYYYTCRD